MFRRLFGRAPKPFFHQPGLWRLLGTKRLQPPTMAPQFRRLAENLEPAAQKRHQAALGVEPTPHAARVSVVDELCERDHDEIGRAREHRNRERAVLGARRVDLLDVEAGQLAVRTGIACCRVRDEFGIEERACSGLVPSRQLAR